MGTRSAPELFSYGIQNERSDVRAHVCVLARTVYVYKTKQGIAAIDPSRHRKKQATQNGVNYVTGEGYVVPWKEIQDIRYRKFHSCPYWAHYNESLSTSEKGKLAVKIVENMMSIGQFPFWVDAGESSDSKLQIQGTDIIVYHKARVQVKCDYKGGSGHPHCTGNLFLQTAERNPFKQS